MIAPCVVFALASLPAGASVITIDNFETVQDVSVTIGGSGTLPASNGNVANTATAIGGERDLWVTKVAGANNDAITARVNPNSDTLLRHSQASGVRGTTRVTWDGADGDPDVIDFDGLGGLNFGLAASGYFELAVTFNNVAGPVDIAVYDASNPSATIRAVGRIDVAAGIDDLVVPTIYQLAFSAMTLEGGATADLFRNVGAITMTINAGAAGQGGRDTDILYVRANNNGIPVPGVAHLLSLGLIGLVAACRRNPARH